MKNGAPLVAFALAVATYLAVTEPGTPAAQPVAVTPTDATTVQAATTSGYGVDFGVVRCPACPASNMVTKRVPEHGLLRQCFCGRQLLIKGPLNKLTASLVAVEIVGNDTRKPALADPAVVESVYWRTDFNAAQLEASQRRKPLVRLVTNVATCAPCRALEAGPLSDQDTIKWLNRNVVMTQRRPYRGEGIPFLEVQVRPNVWRKVSIATYKTNGFLPWFRGVIQ